jgi:2-hydroxy-3-oxopropionate reductase
MAQKVGFIGLGVMGAPMARKLAGKYDVIVYDMDPVKTGAVPGTVKAAGVSEVGRATSVVLLSLPGVAVRDVVLGENGLMKNMKKGGVIIDTSTSLPEVSQELEKTLEKTAGISFLDAPVSGGEKAAVDGTLSIMVGGREDVFKKNLEVLQSIGTTIVRMGGSGMGNVTKLVNNLIVGITFVAVAEGFALGTKSGLDPKVLYEAIRNGWAGSKVLDVSAAAILPRDFKPGGTVNIHWKDLGYALQLAEKEDVPVPATALAHEIFKTARASGRGLLSQPSIINLWEDLLKIEVK